jgi:hypothetical protein
MNCLCGKKMNFLGKIICLVPPNMALWVCPPDGCGRIFVEGGKGEGTWYTAEQNERRGLL